MLFVLLSVRVIQARMASGVGLGDGGDRILLRRRRVHANFAEYAPFCIVLMATAELQNAPAPALHVIGLLLIAGRISHAYGVSQDPENGAFRVAGMAMTFAALISGALANLGLGSLTGLILS